ncbi:hypothetical protein [Adhaeribacter soli]|uniref:Uncharacterized protein n=1 Tax=Adhaeribacter soli TaxID=2607655 RepID=A0A5N1J2V2_9BACT|nr:hypothetical protein [Adhaeribacter soli]KAA9340096.1 hypothetical protein F0P94_07025 [Adhaeribacter soli]
MLKKVILTIFLCSICYLGFSQQTKAQKQILVVDVFEPFNSNALGKGIYISEAGKETKYIKFDHKSPDEKVYTMRLDLVAKTFRDLYSEGWILVSSNGGDMHKRYVFEK